MFACRNLWRSVNIATYGRIVRDSVRNFSIAPRLRAVQEIDFDDFDEEPGTSVLHEEKFGHLGQSSASDLASRKKIYLHQKGRTFIDLRRITVRGGAGGHGCVSFQKDRFGRFPRRDGADGGKGGRVIIRPDPSLSSLHHIPSLFIGKRGGNASGRKCIGHDGEDAIITVPLGTLVTTSTDEVASLDDPSQELIIVYGGDGGLGNTSSDVTVRPVDRLDERVRGRLGEEKRVTLELKTIADVGLVGMPNAGKSTFLTAVSRAHPKVAPYPFTTLNPYLGVVEFSDYYRFTIADIPGLAIGAHANIGLGHSFLRHIEKSKTLLYILDMSGELDARDPRHVFDALKRELELYRPGLSKKRSIIAANKMDRPLAIANLAALRKHTNVQIVPVSAHYGRGITEATGALRRVVEELNTPQQVELQGQSFLELLLSK